MEKFKNYNVARNKIIHFNDEMESLLHSIRVKFECLKKDVIQVNCGIEDYFINFDKETHSKICCTSSRDGEKKIFFEYVIPEEFDQNGINHKTVAKVSKEFLKLKEENFHSNDIQQILVLFKSEVNFFKVLKALEMSLIEAISKLPEEIEKTKIEKTLDEITDIKW